MTMLFTGGFGIGIAPTTARADTPAGTPPVKRCFEGEVLEGLEKKELAQQAYRECAEAEAKKSSEKQHFWSWMATAAKDALGVVGFLALFFAAFGVIFWIVLYLQGHGGKRSREQWPAEQFLAPTLVVGSFDDTGVEKQMGPAIGTLVRAGVKPHSGGHFDVVTGHGEVGESLKPLAEISDEAKAAIGIVTFLLGGLPWRRYEATGALQEKGERGAGISLEFTDGKRWIDGTTLWTKEFGAAEDEVNGCQFLSIPAAAWVGHRIATELEETDGLPDDPKVWMLFNAGAAWQQQAALDKAKPLYESALELDPKDRWTMSNLGLIELIEGNYERSVTLLTDALEAFEELT